jgi:uncharacterized protein (TIGR03435 family)
MNTWIDLAGWTLLHFLWQGALVWAVAALALRALHTAQARYALACVALTVMLAAPVVTALALSDGAAAFIPARAVSVPPADTTAPPSADRPASAADAAPAPAASIARSFDAAQTMPVIVTVWLSGVALLLMRLAGGCWRVRRLRAAALGDPVSRWQEMADALARRLCLARPVFIVDSKRVDTPMVIGWLRPVIVLPVAALASLTPAQVEAILAHELAHIRRHDFLANALQTFAETLLFYHPAVWWISGRIRAERENCCDDVAVEVCGDPVTYAAALTELAAWSLARPPLVLAATSGSLLARVRRLLQVSADGTPRSSSGMLVGGLALALVVIIGSVRAISVTQVSAQDGPGANDGRFGPPDANRLLGFELFPGPRQWPSDDPRASRAWGVRIRYTSGEMKLLGFTARSVIRHAYDVPNSPLVGVPTWLDEETFDLTAVSDLPMTAGVADPEAFQVALRDMVERQLGLVVHREQREFPVYALVRATPDGRLGPNIALSTSDCVKGDPGGRPFSRHLAAPQRLCGIDHNLTGIRAEGVTLREFVEQTRPDTALAPELPLVDRTGLSDRYDFRLRFGFLPIAAIGAGHPLFGAAIEPLGFRSLFSALPEQLGLKLERSTAPFEVLVIDEIHRPQP